MPLRRKLNCTWGWSASSDIGTALSGNPLRDHQGRQPQPEGVVVMPACQIDTFSAFHVSAGPTLIALGRHPGHDSAA